MDEPAAAEPEPAAAAPVAEPAAPAAAGGRMAISVVESESEEEEAPAPAPRVPVPSLAAELAAVQAQLGAAMAEDEEDEAAEAFHASTARSGAAGGLEVGSTQEFQLDGPARGAAPGDQRSPAAAKAAPPASGRGDLDVELD